MNPIIDWLRPFQFRGKARLLGPLIPKSGEWEGRVFGWTMRLDLSEHIQRNIYLGTYEREETKLVKNYLGKGMSFIDVGANFGYFTALAAKMCGPTGKIVAIEPSPFAFSRLQGLIEKNSITFAKCYNWGLGSIAGTLLLHLPEETDPIHSPTIIGEPTKNSVEVKIVTLDELLDMERLSTVDLMKVDVEGFEPEVFKGGRKSLETGKVKAILCELNDVWLRKAGTSAEALYRFILDMGFTCSHKPKFFPGSFHNCFFVWNGS